MNILLYKGKFNYDVVNYFIDELRKSFIKRKHNVYVYDLYKDINDKDDCLKLMNFINEKKIDFIFSFNGISVFDSKFYKYKKIVYGTMITDNPFYHFTRLRENYKNKKNFIGLADEGVLNIVEKYIEKDLSIYHIMHGGSYSNNKDNSKKYDVLVAGEISDTLDFEEYIKNLPDEMNRKIARYLYYNSRENYEKTLYEYLDEIISQLGIDKQMLEIEQNKTAIACIYTSVDRFIRKEDRYKTVLDLLENGIEVNHFGECECEIFNKYPNFKKHGSVSYTQMLDIISQSKILINVITYFNYFKNGSHERVFSAMLNKALVITNNNNYSYNMYKDKESIVIFDANKKNDLAHKVKYYLNNDEEREKIVENAYEITSKFNTWENRADEILKAYNEIRNQL